MLLTIVRQYNHYYKNISVTVCACALLQLSFLNLIHANLQSFLVTVDTVLMVINSVDIAVAFYDAEFDVVLHVLPLRWRITSESLEICLLLLDG